MRLGCSPARCLGPCSTSLARNLRERVDVLLPLERLLMIERMQALDLAAGESHASLLLALSHALQPTPTQAQNGCTFVYPSSRVLG